MTGIDIAADMIEVAKTVPAPEGATIDWRVADAASLPVADASVDVVLCQMGLMFMEDRAAAIAEMHRVLVPSGRVVVNTPGRIQPVYELMEQALVEHISPDLGGFVSAVFSLNDPDAVATLLREAGLRDVSATVSTCTFRLPAPAEFLWQYINLTPMAELRGTSPGRRQVGPGAPVRRRRASARGRRGNGGRPADGDRDRTGITPASHPPWVDLNRC